MHKLVEIGKQRFVELKNTMMRHQFTRDDAVDGYFNRLEEYPHLYVLSCLMDRGIKAEKAWSIPYYLCKYFNAFEMSELIKLEKDEIRKYFLERKPHRFNEEMAEIFYNGVQRIQKVYGGDASRIWKNRPSSAHVVYEFLQFDGCGIKIATMMTNILVRHYGIELSDYYSIDVSPDVHIKRIFYRVGLTANRDDVDSVIYKARELYPEFPGIVDLSCWEIGRNYCHPKDPECERCSLNKDCQKRIK